MVTRSLPNEGVDLLDRPFPQAIDAERALLGGLLQEPNRLQQLDLKPTDFYHSHHGNLYRLLVSMLDAGKPIDLVSVTSAMEHTAKIYGGVAYVVELPEHCPSAANLGHYAALIQNTSDLRGLIRHARMLAERAYMAPIDESVTDLVAEGARSIQKMMRTDNGDRSTFKTALNDTLDYKESVENGTVSAPFVSSGFPSLDANIGGGLYLGEMTVVAARTAMGKTAFALNIAMKRATEIYRDDQAETYEEVRPRVVVVVSMEMRRSELIDRWLAMRVGVLYDSLRRNQLSQEDWDKIIALRSELDELPIVIYDGSCYSVEQLRALVDAESMTHDVDTLVIDYIGLMPSSPATQSKDYGSNAKGCKGIAKDYNCAVVLLAQLNKSGTSQEDKRPKITQVFYGDEIAMHTNLMIALHRPSYYGEGGDKRLTFVFVLKQRAGVGGPNACVNLKFFGELQMFIDDEDERLAA